MEERNASSDDCKPPLVEDLGPNQDRRGGWTAVKYILVNETFEKLASMSLISNITVYLKTKYNMEGIMLVNVVSVWSGSSNILSILGALLSDAYFGRFHTLLIGSIASFLGMCGMTLTSAVSTLRPPNCINQELPGCIGPNKWHLGFLYASLGLLAIGSSCIRPCNIAFGADQFNSKTEKGRIELQRFYNIWYLSFTIALLISLTVVVYIQTNVSWVLGFAIPTCCFIVSIAGLLLGCRSYVYNEPQGSIFIDMVKVCVAAYRKRKLSLDSIGDQSFYDPSSPSGVTRTSRLKFLEKAALISHRNEVNDPWRLCSMQQVEQLKSLIGILPVWLSSILAFEVMDQQSTFGILQALQMDRKLGSRFVIPSGWIGLVPMLALSLCILVYERLIIPLLKKTKNNESARLSVKQRIRIGIIMSILCMLVAGFVEKQRRSSSIKSRAFVAPLSIFILVPQLAFSGMVEAFACIAILELFTTQMPQSMRSVAGSIFFCSLSIGSYMSSAIVNIIYKVTKNGEGQSWLGGQDLNKNRLDYFYFILAGLGVINLVYYTLFASKYIFVGELGSSDEANSGPLGLTGIEVRLSRELSHRSN